MKTVFRIILYLLLLALIPAVIYFVQPTALFASLPFSQEKISQRQQSDVYQQATEQIDTSKTKKNSELPTYDYQFPNPQVIEDLVLIDLMKVWEDGVRVGQQGAGSKVTAMKAPTKWLSPSQEGAIFSPIHEYFVWRAVAIMRGNDRTQEQIEKEDLGVDPESNLGTGGEAVKIRQAMERVISSRTVEDVIPAVGKQKLKEELRQELNRILNNKVVAVYLDLLLFQ